MKGIPKTEKNLKKFWNFFSIKKANPSLIFELCQHLGSLRSPWKAPETETLTWTRVKTLYLSGLKSFGYWVVLRSCRTICNYESWMSSFKSHQQIKRDWIGLLRSKSFWTFFTFCKFVIAMKSDNPMTACYLHHKITCTSNLFIFRWHAIQKFV